MDIASTRYNQLRDLGPTVCLLGVEIAQKKKEHKFYLSQRQYVINKLDEFDMADCKPVGTYPYASRTKIDKGGQPKNTWGMQGNGKYPLH